MICDNVLLSPITNPNTNELSMDITNGNGGVITIARIYVIWEKTPPSQKLDKIFLDLDTNLLWNQSDNDPPSDIPAEGNLAFNSADRTIADGAIRNIVLRFQDALQLTGNVVHIVFDIGCQVIGSQ